MSIVCVLCGRERPLPRQVGPHGNGTWRRDLEHYQYLQEQGGGSYECTSCMENRRQDRLLRTKHVACMNLATWWASEHAPSVDENKSESSFRNTFWRKISFSSKVIKTFDEIDAFEELSHRAALFAYQVVCLLLKDVKSGRYNYVEGDCLNLDNVMMGKEEGRWFVANIEGKGPRKEQDSWDSLVVESSDFRAPKRGETEDRFSADVRTVGVMLWQMLFRKIPEHLALEGGGWEEKVQALQAKTFSSKSLSRLVNTVVKPCLNCGGDDSVPHFCDLAWRLLSTYASPKALNMLINKPPDGLEAEDETAIVPAAATSAGISTTATGNTTGLIQRIVTLEGTVKGLVEQHKELMERLEKLTRYNT